MSATVRERKKIEWLPLAVLMMLLLVLGAARLELVSPLAAFAAFILAWLLGGVVLLGSGLLALRRGDGVGPALLFGAVLLLALMVAMVRARAPRIHDITTSPDDAPPFTTASAHPANRGRDLAYPNGSPETAELQRQAYADLSTLRLTESTAVAYRTAVEVAEALGWTVTWTSPADGLLEAQDMSTLFRFVDDIVIRVRGTDSGSEVDVRSLSRVGQSDLGANAARIREFMAAMSEELSAER